MKPAVIIALEGIVISNPLPNYWRIVAAAAEKDVAQVENEFKTISSDLYTGRIPETEFWSWLAETQGLAGTEWQYLLYERCYPLLAAYLLPRLAAQADVFLLAEQPPKWFQALLTDEDIDYDIQQVICTQAVQAEKTDPRLFQLFTERRPYLYIDTNQQALHTARQAGLTTLEADPELYWFETSLQWLSQYKPLPKWKSLLKRFSGR